MKTRFKKSTFTVLFLIYISFNFAQENSLVFKVLDSKTKTPISYTTVLLKNNNRGTHADFDGIFKIPSKYFKEGIIKISSIGYVSKTVELAKCKKSEINVIYLSESTNNLEEVKIIATKKVNLNSRQIVEKAIDNILENYPTQPYSYLGYYRDYQQAIDTSYKKVKAFKKNSDYINLHEGIVEVFDAGFSTKKFKNDRNQGLLYDYGINLDFPKDEDLLIPYDLGRKKFAKDVAITPFGGNELNILHITNAIRNHDTNSFSFVEVFDKNFVDNHFFRKEGIKDLDDVSLYQISFVSNPKKTGVKFKAKGNIYISKVDFSIYKLQYDLFLNRSSSPHYSVNLEYLPKGDKMFLNYMMFNNSFNIRGKDFFKLEEGVFHLDRNVFEFSFNRPIDKNSLKRWSKNFKITFNGKKIKILDITSENNYLKSILIKVNEKKLKRIGFFEELENENFSESCKISIENITDKKGNKINNPPVFQFYQFRELFVQEVFVNKDLPSKVHFIDKNLPLNQSKITSTKLKENYWINTPLKKSKN